VFGLSCNGSETEPGLSTGLPRWNILGSLDTPQAGTLCDWANAKQGGYGRSVMCPDGSEQTTDDDKATCVQTAPLFADFCPTLTVGDVEDCVNAIGTDLCALATASGGGAIGPRRRGKASRVTARDIGNLDSAVLVNAGQILRELLGRERRPPRIDRLHPVPFNRTGEPLPPGPKRAGREPMRSAACAVGVEGIEPSASTV
jgi:hypothetical protein